MAQEYDDVTNLLHVCGTDTKIPHTGDTESPNVCGQQRRKKEEETNQVSQGRCEVIITQLTLLADISK